jgi:hypothetical protein
MKLVSHSLDSKIYKLVKQVQENLTPDLLKPKWKNKPVLRPFEGYCYVASEALYHLLNDRTWIPQTAPYKDEFVKASHWWLKNKVTGEIVDPTRKQFLNPFPYHLGRGTGFMTKKPSKRAQKVLDRINETQTG